MRVASTLRAGTPHGSQPARATCSARSTWSNLTPFASNSVCIRVKLTRLARVTAMEEVTSVIRGAPFAPTCRRVFMMNSFSSCRASLRAAFGVAISIEFRVSWEKLTPKPGIVRPLRNITSHHRGAGCEDAATRMSLSVYQIESTARDRPNCNNSVLETAVRRQAGAPFGVCGLIIV